MPSETGFASSDVVGCEREDGARVQEVLTAVLHHRRNSIQSGELQDARAMALRIIQGLRERGPTPLPGPGQPDIVAHLAVFVALKTECVYSPMSHHRLVRLTGLTWRELKAREALMLCTIRWRLYAGALPCKE